MSLQIPTGDCDFGSHRHRMNLADEKTQPSIIDIIGGRGLGRNEKHLGKLKKICNSILQFHKKRQESISQLARSKAQALKFLFHHWLTFIVLFISSLYENQSIHSSHHYHKAEHYRVLIVFHVKKHGVRRMKCICFSSVYFSPEPNVCFAEYEQPPTIQKESLKLSKSSILF